MKKHTFKAGLAFFLVFFIFLIFTYYSRPLVESALNYITSSEEITESESKKSQKTYSLETYEIPDRSPVDPQEYSVARSWLSPYFYLLSRVFFYASVALIPLFVIIFLIAILTSSDPEKKHTMILALVMMSLFLVSQCMRESSLESRPASSPGDNLREEQEEQLNEEEEEEEEEDQLGEQEEQLNEEEEEEEEEDQLGEQEEQLNEEEEEEQLGEQEDPLIPGEITLSFDPERPGYFYKTQNIYYGQPVFLIEGQPGTDFLRTNVLTEITEDGLPAWDEPNDFKKKFGLVDFSEIKQATSYSRSQIHQFKMTTISERTNDWLPLPNYPHTIRTGDTGLYFSKTRRLARTEEDGEFYFEHEVRSHMPRQLSRLKTASVSDEWLAGNKKLEPEVEDWLDNFKNKQPAGLLESPYRLALALEKYFLDNFPFSLIAAPPPRDRDFLYWFLFEEKRGNAQVQNIALTLLLRELKIPARLVHGYRVNPGAERQFITRGSHTIVEVPFYKAGFVHFDGSGINEKGAEKREVELSIIPQQSAWRLGEKIPVVIKIQDESSEKLPQGRLRWRLLAENEVVLENKLIFHEAGELVIDRKLPLQLKRAIHTLEVEFPGHDYETDEGWISYNFAEDVIVAETWLPRREVKLTIESAESHWYLTDRADVKISLQDEAGLPLRSGAIKFSLNGPDGDTAAEKTQELTQPGPLHFHHDFSATSDTGSYQLHVAYKGDLARGEEGWFEYGDTEDVLTQPVREPKIICPEILLIAEDIVRPGSSMTITSSVFGSSGGEIENISLELSVSGPDEKNYLQKKIFHAHLQEKTVLNTNDWPEGHYRIKAEISGDNYLEPASAKTLFIVSPSLFSRFSAVFFNHLPFYVIVLVLFTVYIFVERYILSKSPPKKPKDDTVPFEKLLKAPRWSKHSDGEIKIEVERIKEGDLAVLPTGKILKIQLAVSDMSADIPLKIKYGDKELLDIENCVSKKIYPVELMENDSKFSRLEVLHGKETVYQQKIWFVPYREELLRTAQEVFDELRHKYDIPGHWTLADLIVYLADKQSSSSETDNLIDVFYRVRYGEFEPSPQEFSGFFSWLRKLTYRSVNAN